MGLAIEQPSTRLRCSPAPLLEEERNVFFITPVAQVADPVRIASPMAVARFAAGDKPVNSAQGETVERSQERLGGYEANGRVNVAQVVRAVNESAVLD